MSALAHVAETPGLLRACTAFQDGDTFVRYEDGDAAAAQGHLSLLKLRRELAQGKNGPVDERRAFTHDSSRTRAALSLECRASGPEAEQVVPDLRYTSSAADGAAANGHLETLRWLLEARSEGCTEAAVDGACWSGHENVVRWLMCDAGKVGSERALDYAASTGRIELVEFLHAWGVPCTRQAMDGAAGGGHLKMVQWLAKHRREGCSSAAFDMAAAEGHLNIIEWLSDEGLLRCSSTGLDNAAGGGHVHLLEWSLKNKPDHQCTTNAYGLAAARGRIETLRWLREAMPTLGCPNWAAEKAAIAGHLEVIKWLHETGLCEAALVCLDEVAREGRLDVVMWLNDNGARATRAAVDLAAEAGHTSIVLYLLENRQEGFSGEAMLEAARNGHLDIVRHLWQFGYPDLCGDCLAARAIAEANGHHQVARFLDNSDPDMLQALQEAVMACDLADDLAAGGGGSINGCMDCVEANSSGCIPEEDASLLPSKFQAGLVDDTAHEPACMNEEEQENGPDNNNAVVAMVVDDDGGGDLVCGSEGIKAAAPTTAGRNVKGDDCGSAIITAALEEAPNNKRSKETAAEGGARRGVGGVRRGGAIPERLTVVLLDLMRNVCRALSTRREFFFLGLLLFYGSTVTVVIIHS